MNSSKPKHKLNIFDVLGKLGKGNSTFYRDLTEEEQKALHPLVVMRWMTGSNDVRRVVFLNEFVNPHVFPLAKHKELLVQLIAICSGSGSGRPQWLKPKSSKGSKLPTITGVVMETFGYSRKHAHESLPLLSNEEIMNMAETLGRQPDDIRVIKKELKTR